MIDNKVLKKIELIVFDLDGTLLRSDNSISDKTIKYIIELKSLGVRFSFATGRLHSAIIDHAETLDLRTPLISLDGSLIKSFPEGKILYESYVPEKYVKRAIDLTETLNLNIALCHDDAIYYTEQNSSIPELLEKLGARYEKVHSYKNYMNHTLEMVVTGNEKDALKKIYKKMTFPKGFGLSTSFYKSHEHEEIYYLEIRKKGCSKGSGFKRLAKHLGIKIKYTAIMGDWYNDISMFETDALKVAVANAVPDVKRLADFITKNTNDDDAASDFLELVLKSKK
jgi:Cof subfamily protein (haloacid dehalogenase superfamily)